MHINPATLLFTTGKTTNRGKTEKKCFFSVKVLSINVTTQRDRWPPSSPHLAAYCPVPWAHLKYSYKNEKHLQFVDQASSCCQAEVIRLKSLFQHHRVCLDHRIPHPTFCCHPDSFTACCYFRMKSIKKAWTPPCTCSSHFTRIIPQPPSPDVGWYAPSHITVDLQLIPYRPVSTNVPSPSHLPPLRMKVGRPRTNRHCIWFC